MKFNADQLRKMDPEEVRGKRADILKNEIYIVLDDILDTYNIGSVFRLADAVSAKKVYLCAGSETPPNHRIKKASINTTDWVDWEYFEKTEDAIADLRTKYKDLKIIAIEQAEGAVSYDTFDYKLPLALVVGHESDGVSKKILKLCDAVVQLPMFGVNISLNVMVSLGIVLYRVISDTNKGDI
jgi:23S rRNA (guanosine2251-2'-O)-methyltransferase